MSQTAQASLFPAKETPIREPWPLPSGWEWERIDNQLVEMQSGFACARKHSDPSGLPHLRPFNVGLDGEVDLSQIIRIPFNFRQDLSDFSLRAGDVLFNNTNSVELVGKTAIVREPLECAFSNHLTRLRVCAPNQLDPRWLALALRLLQSQGYFSQRCNRWIGQAGFNPTKLAEVSIPLPKLDIQRRIVARIEALLAELKEARALAAAIRRDTDRVMEAALVEAVSEFDRRFNPLSIGQLVETGRLRLIGGGTPSKANSTYWMGPTPWVSPKDMKRWLIDDAEDHISESALQETSAKRIQRGAVLVVVRGMILAHTWPVAVTTVDVAINQDMKALCPTKSFKPEYLGYVLRSRAREVLGQVEIAAHGTRRLKSETLEAVTIPDAPLPMQEQLVTYLDSIQEEVSEMRHLQAQDAQLLDQLEQSILERAFRGEL